MRYTMDSPDQGLGAGAERPGLRRARRALLVCALLGLLSGCADVLGLSAFGPADGAVEADGGAADAGPPAFADSLALGGAHSCWLHGGRIHCWGSDSDGQLGDGTVLGNRQQPSLPVTTPEGASWRFLAAGGRNTCAATDSAFYCWGRNDDDQLAPASLGAAVANATAPVAMTRIPARPNLAAMEDGYMAAVSGSTLYLWGRNDNGGTLGPPGDTSLQTLTLSSNAVRLDVGSEHGCVVLDTGALECWGDSTEGQLARDAAPDFAEPGVSDLVPDVSAVAAGDDFTCVVSRGQVRCFGDNSFGTLGNGVISTSSSRDVVTPNLPASTYVDVRAQHHSACALSNAGELYCWGEADDGQVGLGSTTACPGDLRSECIPTPTLMARNVRTFDVGEDHICALEDVGGAIHCWGSDASGRLGAGDGDQSGAEPVQVLLDQLVP